MRNSLSIMDQELITSNFCSSHWYFDDNYLLWKFTNSFQCESHASATYYHSGFAPFFTKRSYFAMQTSISVIDRELITSCFCSILWKFTDSFQCKRHASATYHHSGFSSFFIKRSYFSMRNSLLVIDQELSTSNFCSSHWYIDDIYLMFWKPGPNSPITAGA